MGTTATLEIDATITERGQTTVPAAIRKMLGVSKGAIVFKAMPDGTVIVEAKRDESEEDPVLEAFLSFLAHDIARNPQAPVPLSLALLQEGRNLVGDVAIDLDAPLDDD